MLPHSHETDAASQYTRYIINNNQNFLIERTHKGFISILGAAATQQRRNLHLSGEEHAEKGTG